jgi:hypothetical protein
MTLTLISAILITLAVLVVLYALDWLWLKLATHE